MSPGADLLLAVASTALCIAVAAFVMLGTRTFVRNRGSREREKVPVLIGICRWPALLLVPAVPG